MICNCSCFVNTNQQGDSAESCFEEEIDGDEYEDISSEDDSKKKAEDNFKEEDVHAKISYGMDNNVSVANKKRQR